MRILAIRGKNLASLRGEFAVELEKPPLEQAGLFAITGHTGAGKSTLLDALCLALFDKIPRLVNAAVVKVGRSDENEKERISSNDVAYIMSRGTANAYAQVDFVGTDKQVYQAHWEVKRARNKVSGRLQKQSVTLKNLNNNEQIGQNKSDTLEEITQLIGLNFEQFRRSVLLAQGDFSAFLKAKSDERSGLLERITGTEIYSEISIAAYRRFQKEEMALKAIQNKLSLEMPLEDEQRQALNREIKEISAQQNDIRKQIEKNKTILDWFNTRVLLRKEINSAEALLQELKTEKENKQTEKEQLDKVVSVQALRELNNRVTELAKSHEKISEDYQQAQSDNKVFLEDIEKIDISIKNIQTQLNTKKTEFNEIKPQLLQARELDTHLKIASQAYHDQQEKTQNLEKEFQQYKLKIIDSKSLDKKKHEIESVLSKIIEEQNVLLTKREIVALEELSEREEKNEQSLNVWLEARKIYDNNKSKQNELENNLNEKEKIEATISEQMAISLSKNNEQLKLSAVVDEARQALILLQESVTHDVQSLRGLLNENEPCPVCGSLEHPWAGENSTLNKNYHQQKERVIDLENNLKNCLLDYERSQQVLKLKKEQKKQKDIEIEKLNIECRDLHRGWENMISLIPITTSLIDSDNEVRILSEIKTLKSEKEQLKELHKQAILLQKDIDRCQSKKDQWQKKEKELENIVSEQSILSNTITNLKHQLQSLKKELNKCRQHKNELQQQRALLLNGQPADVIEESLNDIISQLSKQLDTEKESFETIKQQQIKTTQQCLNLQQQQKTVQVQLDDYKEKLNSELKIRSLSFETLKVLLAKEESWISAQTESFQRLDSRLIQAETVLKERTIRLQEHESVQFDEIQIKEETPEELQEQLQQQEKSLKKLLLSHQEKQLILRQDDERIKRIATFQKELDVQKSCWQEWGELNDLIGSASGQKFRIFAQSLTLESLIAHANIHLNDFARRYQLQRVPGTDLDLQIVDRDMADEIRSIQSLSGGESFLVSLALALGLASLSSTKTQVESLFIDEGFGTLDQETLDIAIASLDTLQGLGRKVGIISHVPILVERIGTRVVVDKLGGGQSKIRLES